MALTKQEQALLDKMGITLEQVAKVKATTAKQEATDKAAALLGERLVTLLGDLTISESGRSAWVGASVALPIERDGKAYSVKVTYTDTAATAAREAILKPAKKTA